MVSKVASYHRKRRLPPRSVRMFSALNGLDKQRLLKNRMRQLFELGINKNEDTVVGSQWITEADFRSFFPDDLDFAVETKGILYIGSLYDLWNDVFTKVSFQDKLKAMNDKITTYREAIADGINPNIAVLHDSHPAAESRFLEKAGQFADRFWAFGSLRNSDSTHVASELADMWQFWMLMKVAFDLK